MASNGLRLSITNIPWTVGRHELALYFSQFGFVHEAFVAFNKQTGLHQGYGYVTLSKVNAPRHLLEHKHSLEGRNLVVSVRNNGNIQ